MPGVPINDGNDVRAPRYLDLRQGKIVNGKSVPYDDPTEILTAVLDTRKAEGLPFYVKNGAVVETWRLALDTNGNWITVKDAGSSGGAGWTFKGEWNQSTAYSINDVVTSNGSSFIALKVNTGTIPAPGATWGLLAEKGNPGSGGSGANARVTFTLTGDGTYAMTAGDIITAIIVDCASDFTLNIGSTSGAIDIASSLSITGGAPESISIIIYAKTDRTIYFSGIPASTSFILIKNSL